MNKVPVVFFFVEFVLGVFIFLISVAFSKCQFCVQWRKESGEVSLFQHFVRFEFYVSQHCCELWPRFQPALHESIHGVPPGGPELFWFSNWLRGLLFFHFFRWQFFFWGPEPPMENQWFSKNLWLSSCFFSLELNNCSERHEAWRQHWAGQRATNSGWSNFFFILLDVSEGSSCSRDQFFVVIFFDLHVSGHFKQLVLIKPKAFSFMIFMHLYARYHWEFSKNLKMHRLRLWLWALLWKICSSEQLQARP